MTARVGGWAPSPPGSPRPDPQAVCASLSEDFDGAVVALVSVDAAAETITPAAVFDPDRPGQRALELLVGVPVPLEGTICAAVCATGEPAVVGEGGSVSDDALPDGWLHYSRQHHIEAAVALPVEPEAPVARIVVVGRRGPVPFDAGEVARMATHARRRILGREPAVAPATPLDAGAVGPAAGDGQAPRAAGRRFLFAVDVVLGLVPPVVLAATLGRSSSPNSYRPTSVLLLAVAALGLLRGRVAAAVCAAVGMVAIWWSFTAPYRSFGVEDGRAVVGLVVLAGVLATMLALVERVERSRRKLADAAGLSDALIDQMPVGFALAGRDRRLRRVNQRFADLTGSRPEELRGGLPSVLLPATGARSEALVQQVLDEGTAVLDTVLAADRPEVGIEHTWRVNHFPVRSGGHVVAVGMTLEDVTEDVIIRRRAQLLLRLSRRVAGATTSDQIAEAVTEILAEGLRARCLFAVTDGSTATVVAAAGYRDAAVEERWGRFSIAAGGPGSLATSLRASELVLGSVPQEATGADDAESALRRMAGDVTVAWQPVLRPSDPSATAAIGVAWPYERHLTEHSRTLLQTTASVAGLALARVDLTERTARDRFREAMDAMLDQVLLARAVRDGSGAIVDFEIDFANDAALRATRRSAEATVGHRVRELYPAFVRSGLFERFCRVVETGEPWEVDRMAYADVASDGREVAGWWSVQVMKVDDGYLAASRDVTELVEADRVAAEAREALQREHLAVDLLQRAALPAALPVVAGLDVGAHYRPARLRQPVGGDWYDAFVLDGGELALVVADVAGHGQEAAAYMVQVRNIFRAVATERIRPDAVLAGVDRVLQRLNEPGAPFVTCCYATLDPRTWELRWALAGHPPPLIARLDGTSERGDTTPGPPLATLPDSAYETGSATLGRGDVLVLFTDGLVERREEAIDDGLDRLAEQVRRRPPGGSGDLAAHLAELVPDPTDDIAILCVSPT